MAVGRKDLQRFLGVLGAVVVKNGNCLKVVVGAKSTKGCLHRGVAWRCGRGERYIQ